MSHGDSTAPSNHDGPRRYERPGAPAVGPSRTIHDDNAAPSKNGGLLPRERPAWWIGVTLCLLPPVALAACSLADDGDDASAPPDVASDTTTDAVTPGGSDAASSSNSTPAGGAESSEATTDRDAPGGVDESVGRTDDPATGDGSGDAGTTPTPTATGTATAEDDDGGTPTDQPNETADTDTVTDTDPDASPISFAADVEPIIAETCARCHTGTGPGTQHIRFDTAGGVAKASVGIEFVTQTGYMPPWPAGGESIEYEQDWSLTETEIAVLADWHAAGSPLDVPEDRVIEPATRPVRLQDADMSIPSRGSYDGELGQDDEYRCMVYDPGLDGPGFVTGMDFVPEQEQVVHHAVGFVLDASDRPDVDAIDGADGEGGGWTCFGFQPGRSSRLIYAWAPGQAATRYPEGSGLWLDDGDFFVVQTHYHYDVEAPPDQSTLHLDWLPESEAAGVDPVGVSVHLGPAEIPCTDEESGPLCDRDAAIARAKERYGEAGFMADAILGLCGQTPADYAGFTDGLSRSSCDQRVGTSGEIVTVLGHQHELGSSFTMTLNPDTDDEIVLLDIPEWDFDWQLNYDPVDSIVLEPDDVLRMECSWDRSLRDPDLEPAYVVWSDGTDDEMCFATIVTRPI